MATKKLEIQVEAIVKDIESKLNRIHNKTFMTRLGKMARDIIYKRVKSGYGLTNDTVDYPTKKKLEPLSDGYVYQRRQRQKSGRGDFGQFFSPKRSNLTNTGQMLEAIEHAITSYGFRLYINDNARNDNKLTNEKVAEYVSKMRPFFALTKDEQRILEKQIEDEVRRIFRQSSK